MPFDPEVPQAAPEPQIPPFDVALKELVKALGAAPAAQALVEGGASPREAVQAVEQVGVAPRRVSAPTHTLGGQRMPGSRAMTVQEQTMLERPWVQMGRDAGAFASKAVDTAGLGLPGIALGYAAPNALAGIRENEALANPGVTFAGTAAGLPAGFGVANALGKGIGKAGEAFMSLPRALQGAAIAAPAAALPSEAGPPGGAVKDYEAPGLLREIWNALPGASGKEDRPLSQDEFRQQRRQLQPKSRADYIEKEVDKVRASPRYQEAGKGLRQNLEDGARANAEKMYSGYERDVSDETRRIDSEYGDYRAGWGKQREEHLNKQFVERHPNAGMALTVGGPVASALFTRGIFGKVNKLGEEIAAAGSTARAADDMRGLADSIVRADRYATYAPVTKAATAAEAAAIPAELRMTGDILDKKGLPPDAGARKASEQRMADIPSYLGGMGYDLISGAIGTGTGSLWSKWRTPSPSVDLFALRNNAAGIPRGGFPEMLRGPRLSQDQLAEQLAIRAEAAAAAQNRLAGSVSMPQRRPSTASPSANQDHRNSQICPRRRKQHHPPQHANRRSRRQHPTKHLFLLEPMGARRSQREWTTTLTAYPTTSEPDTRSSRNTSAAETTDPPSISRPRIYHKQPATKNEQTLPDIGTRSTGGGGRSSRRAPCGAAIRLPAWVRRCREVHARSADLR